MSNLNIQFHPILSIVPLREGTELLQSEREGRSSFIERTSKEADFKPIRLVPLFSRSRFFAALLGPFDDGCLLKQIAID